MKFKDKQYRWFNNQTEEKGYSDFALKTVAQSQEDIKNGDFHSFDNVDDAIEFLKHE